MVEISNYKNTATLNFEKQYDRQTHLQMLTQRGVYGNSKAAEYFWSLTSSLTLCKCNKDHKLFSCSLIKQMKCEFILRFYTTT